MDAREYLTQFIGKEIIRTSPALISGNTQFPQIQNRVVEPVYDWTYTESSILLYGLTDKGEIEFEFAHTVGGLAKKKYVMPAYFTDKSWSTMEEAMKIDRDNPLNKWIGQTIKRVRPTARYGNIFVENQNKGYPKLVYVAKNHIVLMRPEYGGKSVIYGPDFVKPDDWILAE